MNTTPKAEAKIRINVTTTRNCQCGCGASTSSSRTQYRPGHDARHAGSVARDFAAYLLANGAETVDHSHSMLDELGSDRLRAKAVNMANRLVAKAQGKKQPADHKPKFDTSNSDRVGEWLEGTIEAFQEAIAETEAQPIAKIKGEPVEAMWDEEDGITNPDYPVKIGRWTYPGRVRNGKVERNTKRDGSGEWIEH